VITTTLHGSRIAGVCTAVPKASAGVAALEGLFGPEEAAKVAKSTGVVQRRIASGGLCTSDLCLVSARKLLDDLGWHPSTVQAVVFVSQTPDYRLPATACVLHGKLGLPNGCIAFDVNLGCSGYVYGLWMVAQFIQASGLQRALLLVGDTITTCLSDRDRSTYPIFGDAGTATAIESAPGSVMSFVLGTDGAGAEHLQIPAGGCRRPSNDDTTRRSERENGNWRSDEDLFMNGAEVFAFTLREVPVLIDKILAAAKWERSTVDHFVFHQANKFMLDHLAKKMKLPVDKIPFSLGEFGNTSSASIPLTISACLREKLAQPIPQKVILAGFGVGWSWGACALEMTGSLVLPAIQEVEAP
jgi:3-oxoacyl-[acyl-carrier-protein] synthase-3